MIIGSINFGFHSYEPFWLNSIREGLKARGLYQALSSLEAGFACIRDKKEKSCPASILRLPTLTLAGLAEFTNEYEIDTRRFAIEAYKYAVTHEESHPMVDSFFVTTLAACAFADSTVPHSSAWSAVWYDIGAEVAWGLVLSVGFIAHPGIAIGLAPIALTHLSRRSDRRRSLTNSLIKAQSFYRASLCTPESWAALQVIARNAISDGVPLPSVVDLVLEKAARREARDPLSSLDENPTVPGVL